MPRAPKRLKGRYSSSVRAGLLRRYRLRKRGIIPTFNRMPMKMEENVLIKHLGAPDSVVLKLAYSERILLSSTTGSIATQVFRGNSLFDPNYTGTGAQPTYFDQWSNFYQKYIVYGCKITVRLASVQTTAPTQAFEALVVPTDNLPGGYTMEDYLGLPYMKHFINNGSSANPVPKIKSYMTTAKINGISQRRVSDDDAYEALVSANPADLWYWTIAAQPVDRASTTSIYAYVDLIYYCKLLDRISVSQS